MKAGDLVWLAGKHAMVLPFPTGNVDFVYVLTHRAYVIMISREHLKLITTPNNNNDVY